MQHIPIYKKLLSYIYPVRIRRSKGDVNPLLDLFVYHGRIQLATHDAVYSDGDKYRPLVTAFKELKASMPHVRNVLVLGTGLGSAVNILNKKGWHPQITLIDNDKVVLQWAMEFLQETEPGKITPICADAKEFIANHHQSYDLLIIDIFSGRVVPGFATTTGFLQDCRKCINKEGHVVLNYIENQQPEWITARNNFKEVFPGCKILEIDRNRILIATV